MNPNNGSSMNREQRRIYTEPRRASSVRMETQIAFNNSMLVANGIDYT
ncbi:hypothetical protein EG68_11132 [Paragonimus skrjabini miyazakii]|uniref:Uncharacterized protein n=1 Tax=Paragonimus skrjabini miyazakii TaxID=59628 RepID=A0A8S9YAA4_9TREM|nr:hypothetical protein EG68_11132 [Paragonimus skrjabini miyazakii]